MESTTRRRAPVKPVRFKVGDYVQYGRHYGRVLLVSRRLVRVWWFYTRTTTAHQPSALTLVSYEKVVGQILSSTENPSSPH